MGGAAAFSPFQPAAGCIRVTGTEEDGDTEQQRKREHHGAGWDVGVRAKRDHCRLFYAYEICRV